MKRSTFIKLSSLAGLAAASNNVFAHPKTDWLTNQIQLPEFQDHVRHGAYDLEKINNKFLPRWLSFYKPNKFLKNGYSAQADDLNIVQFEVDGLSYSACYNNAQFYISNNTSLLEAPAYSNDNCNLTISAAKHRVSLIQTNELDLRLAQESVVLVLEGKLKTENFSLNRFEFLHQKERNAKLIAPSKALVLLIEKF